MTLLLAFLSIEAYTLVRMAYYKKQGFNMHYYPLIGVKWMFVSHRGHKRETIAFRKAYEKAINKPGFVVNNPFELSATVFLCDSGLIRQLASKEVEYTKRTPLEDFKVNLGFFLEGGERALLKRKIFSKFFLRKSLEGIVPKVMKLFDKYVGNSPSEVPTDLKLAFHHLFSEVVNSILFGDRRMFVNKSGLVFTEEIIDLFKTVIETACLHPLNIMTYSWCNRKDLIQAARACRKRADQMSDDLKLYFKERREEYLQERKEGTFKADYNIIDLMIEHNEGCEADEVLSADDVVGNCTIFHLAGMDTTRTVLLYLVYVLARDDRLQEELYSQMKAHGLDSRDGLNLERLDSCEYLHEVVREALRTGAPLSILMDKLVLKDLTLGKYTFRKGDILNIPLDALMTSQSNFPSGELFDRNGFGSRANKGTYLPFWTGQRGCIGQYLAETEIKLIVVLLLARYRVRLASREEEICFRIELTTCISELKVSLEPRV